MGMDLAVRFDRQPFAIWSPVAGTTAMSRRIVKGSVLPGAPEHAHPGSGEDTDGMRVVAAAAFGALVDSRWPRASYAGSCAQSR